MFLKLELYLIEKSYSRSFALPQADSLEIVRNFGGEVEKLFLRKLYNTPWDQKARETFNKELEICVRGQNGKEREYRK